MPCPEGAQKFRERCRAAEALQHQVAGRVVADGHRRGADLGNGHAWGARTALRNGRIFDDVVGAENHAPVKQFRPEVDLLQHQRRGQHLESAADGEALDLASAEHVARLCVEDGDAEAALRGGFDLGEPGVDVGGRWRGARLGDMQGGDG